MKHFFLIRRTAMAALLLFIAINAFAQPVLNLTFKNNSTIKDPTQIFIGFAAGAGSINVINLKDSAPILSLNNAKGPGNWYTLDKLASGVGITNFSGRIYVAYGAAWAVQYIGYEPAQSVNDPNFYLRYDKMELTFNGNAADVADLTSIDYWSIPMSLNTYSNINSNRTKVGTVLGLIKGVTAQDIYNKLNGLTSKTPSGLPNAKPALVPGTFGPSKTAFARIIGPSSYPPVGAVPATPYVLFENYLGYLLTNFGPGTTPGALVPGLGNGVIATIAGNFAGVGPQKPPPGNYLQSKQTYSLQATIDKGLNITLTGTLVGARTLKTKIFFTKADLLNPEGIYGGNAAFSVNDQPKSPPQNDVYGWISADLFAGLNIGAIGSSSPSSKGIVGTLKSSDWFTLPLAALYGKMQPNSPSNYNQWAATLLPLSQAYNFAYSDRFSPVVVSLDPAKVNELEIVLENDAIIKK